MQIIYCISYSGVINYYMYVKMWHFHLPSKSLRPPLLKYSQQFKYGFISTWTLYAFFLTMYIKLTQSCLSSKNVVYIQHIATKKMSKPEAYIYLVIEADTDFEIPAKLITSNDQFKPCYCPQGSLTSAVERREIGGSLTIWPQIWIEQRYVAPLREYETLI